VAQSTHAHWYSIARRVTGPPAGPTSWPVRARADGATGTPPRRVESACDRHRAPRSRQERPTGYSGKTPTTAPSARPGPHQLLRAAHARPRRALGRGAGQVVASTRARGGGGLSVGCIGLGSVGTHTTTGSVKSRRVSLGARASRPSRHPPRARRGGGGGGGAGPPPPPRAPRTIHESCVGLSTPCCLVCIHTTLRAE